MNKARRLCLVLAALLVCIWAAASADAAHAQDGTLTIEGRVVNATPGGGDAASVEVVLHRQDETSREDLTATTDDEGRFRFDDVVRDPSSSYGLSVTYQGAIYTQDLDLSVDESIAVSLTIYDSAQDEGLVSAESVSLLFAAADSASQMISALEIVAIENDSHYTYIPGPEPMDLLRFGLPAGAQELTVDTQLVGADHIQVDRGFALLASVPPGEHEILFAYTFPYSRTGARITKSLLYGASSLRILAPNEVMTISSDQLGPPQSIVIGERPYQLLEATDVPRGTHISLDLGGLAEASLGERIGQGAGGIRFEYGRSDGPGDHDAVAHRLRRLAPLQDGPARALGPSGGGSGSR